MRRIAIIPSPEPGRDLVLLDTTKAEGGGDWSGHLAGTSFIFSHRAVLNTLEGDPRFYFDDSLTPQAQGTGTEEWGGGGDYWGGRNMTLPFAGHPVGAVKPESAKDPEDLIESAYRFLLSDLMPFGKNARITLEHGGTNESTEHYETVTLLVRPAGSDARPDRLVPGRRCGQRGGPPLPLARRVRPVRDHLALRVGRRSSAGARGLSPREWSAGAPRRAPRNSPSSSMPGTSASCSAGVSTTRYRTSAPRSRWRTLGPGRAAWKPAGTWYLAGSNTCVYSNPRDELGPAQHIAQTSNRRLREDEFLLPLALTKGREAIRVRVRFTPVSRPLFPGRPVPPLGWSEIRYDAFCFLVPRPG